MYQAGQEITITWIIEATGSPLLATDYDIRLITSGLDGTYTDDSIVNYIPPTANDVGSLQYLFTPAQPGHYKVWLTCGTAAAYNVINKKDFWVHSP